LNKASFFDASHARHGSRLNHVEIEIGIFFGAMFGQEKDTDMKTHRKEFRAWTRRIIRAKTKVD